MYYFDYNATSPLRLPVKQAMIDSFDAFGNPSSVHQAGRKARMIIENTRDTLAHYLGVLPQNIIFTSSATEANHLLMRGLTYDVCITSAAEHDAVLSSIKMTKAYQNNAVHYVKHLPDGTLSTESFDEILNEVQKKGQKPLLSLMKVNNETGIIQDLSYFSQKIHALGGYVHSDCVQALGKISFDSWLWQCDAITLAAHKVGGPKGVGVLLLRENIALLPLITGGGQEMRRRAGTENISAIHGLNALINVLTDKKSMQQELAQITKMRNQLEVDLLQINPEAEIIGKNTQRVGNTLNILTDTIEAEKQVIIADLNKICLSSGSACASGKVKSSHVLQAYGYSDKAAQCAIRISLGFLTDETACDALLKAYRMICNAKSKLS